MDRFVRNVFIILLISISPILLGSQNAQELFLRGNKAYRQNDWQGAFALYDSIEKKGRAVWYNMGNCLYQLGDFSRAIICWKRAKEGATPSEIDDIALNTQLAYAQLNKQEHDTLWPMMAWGVYSTPTLLVQLIFLLCWYLFWLLGFGMIHCRKLFFYCMLVGLCFAMIVLGNVLLEKYYMQKDVKGIVVRNEAQLFAGPHSGYHPVGVVSLADELCVYEKRPGWYKVSGHDAHGWIPSSNLEII